MKKLTKVFVDIRKRISDTLQKTRLRIRQNINSFLIRLIKALNAKSHPVYTGKLERVPLNYIQKNLIVLTKDGLGKLNSNKYRTPCYNVKTNKVWVLLKDTKITKEYPKDHVFIFEVVDDISYVGIPLHPYFYPYIAHLTNEKIEYHISKNGNALLSEKEIKRLELIKIINSTAGGTRVIKRLKRQGFLNMLHLNQ